MKLQFLIALCLCLAAAPTLIAQCGGIPVVPLAPIGGCQDGSAAHTIPSAMICTPFSLTPCQGRWNLVGVTPSGTAPFPNRDLNIGGISSVNGNGQCDFAVTNGRLGNISINTGHTNLVSSAPNNGPSYLKVAPTRLPFPTNAIFSGEGWQTANRSFGPDQVAWLFEFDLPVTRNYVVSIQPVAGSNVSQLAWRVFDPGTSQAWRARSSNILGGVGSAPSAPIQLKPGWHAIAVFNNGLPINTNFRLNLTAVSQPVPVINSVSTVLACDSSPLTIQGSGFTPSSVVTINGILRTPVSVTPTSMVIPLPSSSSAPLPPMVGYIYTVTVTNPVLGGGGGSDSQNASVNSLAPPTATISPFPPVLVGSLSAITVNGSGFTSAYVVTVNGSPRTTTFVSSTQLAFLPTTNDTSIAQTLIIGVENPACGLVSNLQSLDVICSVPGLNTLSQAFVIEGSASITLTLIGSNFCVGSTVFWQPLGMSAIALPTTVVTGTLVQAAVAASLCILATDVDIYVQSPSPLPVSSTTLPFEVRVPYRGTQEDFIVRSGINSTPTTGPGASIKFANPGDALSLEVESPGGAADFIHYGIYAQLVPTGVVPNGSLIYSYVDDPAFPTFNLIGGSLGFTQLLFPGQNTELFSVPTGLAGLSLFIQAVSFPNPNATVVTSAMLTDAHEIRL
ncbi:MAG: IPT/TIG domain-containing protein [Planctomycetota bacterium]